jgi:hypothetical protein
MVSYDEFMEETQSNNAIVQGALREIDSSVLATALVDLPEKVRHVFFRNMSKRANGVLLEEIRARHGIHAAKIRAAQELLMELLHRHARYATTGEPKDEGERPPEFLLESPQSIIKTFRELAAYVGENGFLPLERVESSISHPIMRKGIEFLVDGWDPLLIRTILEKCIDAHIRQINMTLHMIVDGIESLASKDLPAVTEEKLRAYLA